MSVDLLISQFNSTQANTNLGETKEDATVNEVNDFLAEVQQKNDTVDLSATNTTSTSGLDTEVTDMASYLSKISSLQTSIADLETKSINLNAQIESLMETLESYSKKLQEALDKYQQIEAEIEEKQKKRDKIQDKITKLDEKIATLQKKLTNDSLSESDYESITSELANLNSTRTGLLSNLSSVSNEITRLNSELKSQKQVVNNAETLYDSVNSRVNALTSQQSELTKMKTSMESELNELETDPKYLQYRVSEAEYALVEKNNIDLTEKMPDGSPRYIFAQGAQDNKYHIYDLQKNASLARIYCEGGGFDVVQSGNGYITSFNKTDNGKPVYYMEDCNKMSSFNACITTCSPLSLDLEGDGVNTSSQIINYDIDGDGKTDKINDSADAILVFDKDGDGISGTDGSECFGNNTDLDGDGIKDGFKDGFEALKALAQKEGLVNGDDDNVLDANDLTYLEEKYGLKVKTDGYTSESKSLADIGITEIKLSTSNETTLIDNFDGLGNQLMQQEGATFTINGVEREYADIWHKKIDDTTANSSFDAIHLRNFNNAPNNNYNHSTKFLSVTSQNQIEKENMNIEEIIRKYLEENQ